MMRELTIHRHLQIVVALLISGALVVLACLNTPSTPLHDPAGNVPMLSMPDEPETVPKAPGGHDVIQEPADPDAEPIVRMWTTASVSLATMTIFVDDLCYPGFPSVLERPPQV